MGKTILDYLPAGVLKIDIRKKSRSGIDGRFKSEINEFVSEKYKTRQITTSGILAYISNSISTLAGRKKRIRYVFWVSKDRVVSNQLVFYDSAGSTANPVFVVNKPDATTKAFSVYLPNIKGFFVSTSLYIKPRACSLTNWVGVGYKLDPNEP